MKRRFFTLLAILMLILLSAHAESASFTNAPDVLRPGKTERISFSVPADGTAMLDLIDENGSQAAMIRESMNALQGENHLTWDGTNQNSVPVSPGHYTLRLVVTGESGSWQALQSLQVGEIAPQVTHIQAPGVLVAGDMWNMMVDCSVPGTLEVRIRLENGEWYTLWQEAVQKGTATLSWDGKMNGEWVPSGEYSVQARLTDESGFTGTPQQISLILSDMPTPTPVPHPTPPPPPHPHRNAPAHPLPAQSAHHPGGGKQLLDTAHRRMERRSHLGSNDAAHHRAGRRAEGNLQDPLHPG